MKFAAEAYGTAGLVLTQVAYENDGLSETSRDNQLGGYAGLGARYSFDAFSVFAEYRHQGLLNDVERMFPFGDREYNLQSNVLLVGFGYAF